MDFVILRGAGVLVLLALIPSAAVVAILAALHSVA